MKEDWEIWGGDGRSLALLVPANDPDKPWLTRTMALKYSMPDVTASHAWAVFERALRGGYLLPLLRSTGHAPQPQAPDP